MRVPSWAIRWRSIRSCHQPRQDLGHELTSDRALLAAKVVQPVIGNIDAAADPPIRRVKGGKPGDLAARADEKAGQSRVPTRCARHPRLRPSRIFGSIALAPAVVPRARTSA